jgi:hypothetical protein
MSIYVYIYLMSEWERMRERERGNDICLLIYMAACINMLFQRVLNIKSLLYTSKNCSILYRWVKCYITHNNESEQNNYMNVNNKVISKKRFFIIIFFHKSS